MKKEFKYKSSFSSQINPIVSKDVDKYLALASETNFKKFLPKEIDFNEKIDFLGFAGEAFIANRLNLNDDGVSSQEAIRLANLFPLSFVDVEHDRSHLAGVIVNASYAEFGSGKELTLEEAKASKTPFSVVIGGIIWRIPNPKFAEAVEQSSNPNSEYHGKFFLSWEILFSEAKLIVLDKNQVNFEDGQIINDANEISKLESKLKAFGGTGYTEDGKRIGRVIIGDCIPTAVGIVESPAANVKPITLATSNDKHTISIKASMICPECGEEVEMEGSMEDETEMECAKCGKSNAGKKWKSSLKAEKYENSNSQSETKAVNQAKDIKNSYKIMDIKTRKDITDEALKEAKAFQVISVLDAEIEKISADFEQKKTATDRELKASNDKITDLEKQYKENQDKLAKVEENLQKLAKANAEREIEEVFNTRMNYFDAEYDLSEEKIRNIVARKIKGVDEKTYAEAKEEIELLLAAKKKSSKVFDKKTMKWVDPKEVEKEGKEAKASTEKTDDKAVEDAIDKGDKTKTTIAATTAPTKTLTEQAVEAFGEGGWEVDKRNFRR
jgi:ribosomal protein L37AE/L43A